MNSMYKNQRKVKMNGLAMDIAMKKLHQNKKICIK